MNKTVSTIIGLTVTLAGIAFAAQTTPAPAPKAAPAAASVKSVKATKGAKSTKRHSKKTGVKSRKKSAVAATPKM